MWLHQLPLSSRFGHRARGFRANPECLQFFSHAPTVPPIFEDKNAYIWAGGGSLYSGCGQRHALPFEVYAGSRSTSTSRGKERGRLLITLCLRKALVLQPPLENHTRIPRFRFCTTRHDSVYLFLPIATKGVLLYAHNIFGHPSTPLFPISPSKIFEIKDSIPPNHC